MLAPSGNGTAEEERYFIQLFALLAYLSDYPFAGVPFKFSDKVFVATEIAIRVARERFARGAVCCKGNNDDGHETNPLLQPLFATLFAAVSEIFERRWAFQNPRIISIVNGIVPIVLESDMSLDANILALASASRLSDFAVGQGIKPPRPLVADLRKKALEIVRRTRQSPPLMRRYHHSGTDLGILSATLSEIATLSEFTDVNELDGFASYVSVVFEWVLAHKARTDQVSQVEVAEVALPGLALLGCLCIEARKLEALGMGSMMRAFDLLPDVMDFLVSLDVPRTASCHNAVIGGLAWGLSILSLARKSKAGALCGEVMRRMKSPKCMEMNDRLPVLMFMAHADICVAISNTLPILRRTAIDVMRDLPTFLTMALTSAKNYHVSVIRNPSDSMVAPVLIALVHFTYIRKDRERFTSNVNNWRVLVDWHDATFELVTRQKLLVPPYANPDIMNVIRSLALDNIHRDEMIRFVQEQARTRPTVQMIEIGLVGTPRLNQATANTPSFMQLIQNFSTWMRTSKLA